MLRVLFICKHNRFRSKVAEALFKKYIKDKIKNKSIIAESAGIKLDEKRPYVAPNVKKALKKFGVKKVDNTPRKVTKFQLKRADLIITVANDIKLKIRGKKIVRWKISDVTQKDYNGILKRAKRIDKLVKKLARKLNNNT
jgi:protein-tyrosine-phosphatase